MVPIVPDGVIRTRHNKLVVTNLSYINLGFTAPKNCNIRIRGFKAKFLKYHNDT